jgi:cytochrome c-type biogenesis protein CcmH
MGPALLLALLLALPLAGPGRAAESVEPPLTDPAAEARAKEIGRSLRCLVCQNQSIEDSNAPLAADLRRVVRDRVSAGDGDDQVRRFLVDRYGDWVLLKPPFNARTALLWLAPAVILLLGIAVVRRTVRRQPAGSAAPLSAAEEARVARLLDEPP